MDKELAEIIASAIRSASYEIGTGRATGEPGAIELVAIEIREGSERIAAAIHDLAEATRALDRT